MAAGHADSGSQKRAVEENDDEDDDDEDPIDEEQIEEYKEMVEQLGSFPDKVTINSLSMVAEDHAGSVKNARAIYDCIRAPLISSEVSYDRKLPLVYVIDSILKNVKGKYIGIIEKDAKQWMPVVYEDLARDSARQAKLKKVWGLWRDQNVFSESNWKQIGKCFDEQATSEHKEVLAVDEMSGIPRKKDGTLILQPSLRSAMQRILDDLQSDMTDELEKVSLERLATINPTLLLNIKQAAENGEGQEDGTSGQPAPTQGQKTSGPSNEVGGPKSLEAFWTEKRPPAAIQRSKEWEKANHSKDANDVVSQLQQFLREKGAASNVKYTKPESIQMTKALAVAASTASLLTNALQQLQNTEGQKAATLFSSGSARQTGAAGARVGLTIDKSLFTNDGLKVRNDMIIGLLYEIGLPFVSSVDGRRFATQQEVSNHLDMLFKRNRLDKSSTKTEERGWFPADEFWAGTAEMEEVDNILSLGQGDTGDPSSSDADADPSTFKVIADEERDRCAICGINFKMEFDGDDGVYVYSNCIDMDVLNDEAAATESENRLIHVTCWRGLGSPAVLTQDQTLQDDPL